MGILSILDKNYPVHKGKTCSREILALTLVEIICVIAILGIVAE